MRSAFICGLLLAVSAASALGEPLVLFDFEGDAGLGDRVELQGATARLQRQDGGAALRIAFGHDQAWPGGRLLPQGGN